LNNKIKITTRDISNNRLYTLLQEDIKHTMDPSGNNNNNYREEVTKSISIKLIKI
jgi:hypothetical protein